jgi:hypothetical protein
MITTYSDYIDRFLLPKGLNGAKSPGEHHFVAAYLLPRLFVINQIVPDYINPDGTKGITGDIVYFRNDVHYLGIEVKFGTVRLTKNEFNSWIVNEDTNQHPQIFIGIGTDGIIILSWHKFREAYLTLSGITNPQPILNGYGPQKEVNVLFKSGNDEGYLRRGLNKSEAEKLESEFVQLLEKSVIR